LDFESCVGGLQLPVTHVTSEVHELSTSFERISDWVAARVPQEHVLTVKRSASHRTVVQDGNERGVQGDQQAYFEQVPFYDSEDDLEVTRLDEYIKMGRAAASQAKFSKAENCFQRALKIGHLLSRVSEPIDEADVKQELAVSLLEQGKTVDTRQLCEELVKLKMNNDQDRVRVLDASYTLAQAHLLEGSYPAAQKWCADAMRGRKRLDEAAEPSGAYLNAVWLMATIREAQGDPIDAELYANRLPANFKKPLLKTPSVCGKPTDTNKHVSVPTFPGKLRTH